jgi:hypothetical protein
LSVVLWLFAIQGALGAFDTVYYHELRARLPARLPESRIELELHAARDLVYAILFCTLPFFSFRGAFAGVVLALLAFEVVVTLADFAVEAKTREPEGVLPGERITHGLMAIIYGAAMAHLVPLLVDGLAAPSGVERFDPDVPSFLRALLLAMGAGVAVSGVRDGYAALGLPGGGFPWTRRR